MVDIHFHIEKKHLYVLGLFVLVLVGSGLIYSYNIAGPTNPSTMGHSSNEMTYLDSSIPARAIVGGGANGVIQNNSINTSSMQIKINGECSPPSYVIGVYPNGTIKCSTLVYPENAGFGTISVTTGKTYTDNNYYPVGCVDTIINCGAASGGYCVSNGISIYKGAAAVSVKSYACGWDLGTYLYSSTCSCNIMWDGVQNVIKVYGYEYTNSDHWYFQKDSYSKNLEWYTPW